MAKPKNTETQPETQTEITQPTGDEILENQEKPSGETPQINEPAPENLVIEKEISPKSDMYHKDVWPDGEIKEDNYSPIKTQEIMTQLSIGAEKQRDESSSDAEAKTFSHDGKKYKVILPQVRIPEIGVVTALDIVSDKAAQEYLVKNNAIGSVIQETI